MKVDQVIRDERRSLQLVLRALDKNLTFEHNFKPGETELSEAPGVAVPTTPATDGSPFGYTTQAQADQLVERVNEMMVLLTEIRALLITNGIAQ